MAHHHLELRVPGDPEGHPSLYFWCIRSPGDIAISGTSDDLSDACDVATSALQELTQEGME